MTESELQELTAAEIAEEIRNLAEIVRAVALASEQCEIAYDLAEGYEPDGESDYAIAHQIIDDRLQRLASVLTAVEADIDTCVRGLLELFEAKLPPGEWASALRLAAGFAPPARNKDESGAEAD